jgi:uncharacterized protein
MHHFHSVQFTSPTPGKRLIILGAVHGNEICGTVAIRRVIDEFNHGTRTLRAGSVTFVPVTNPRAYELKRRNGDRNLNRNLAPTQDIREFEDHVANWLCPLLAAHQVLLDIHSFQAQGQPFVMVGPLDNAGPLEPFSQAQQEQAWAARLGVRRAVDGWLSTYAAGVERRIKDVAAQSAPAAHLNLSPKYGVGTTEYMRAQGGIALTLECGQHADPQAPEVAYRAILNTLIHFGVIEGPAPLATAMEGLHIHEVVDKAQEADQFARAWSSFDAVHVGDTIGTRASGQVIVAPHDGYILFPNTQAQPGQEWFYLAQKSARFSSI